MSYISETVSWQNCDGTPDSLETNYGVTNIPGCIRPETISFSIGLGGINRTGSAC
jgi:hypothetical protein